MWTLPAVQLADPGLARELLLRICELHGYAPGEGVHYLDGTMFQPGFSIAGAAAYAVAADRYMRDTSDEQVVEEGILADTLYAAHDDIAARRDERTPLYSTAVEASGSAAPAPFTLHGNAVVAQALAVFRRTLDEETAKGVQDPEAVRAALIRQFSVERDGKPIFAGATDLDGHATEQVRRRRFAALAPALRNRRAHRLHLPPHGPRARRSPGPATRRAHRAPPRAGGAADAAVAPARPARPRVAAEFVDEAGQATANGGDAALSGLLAATVWQAVHVLGVTV